MSNAPRWPGADGSPGLDFSLDRKPGDKELFRDGDEFTSTTVSMPDEANSETRVSSEGLVKESDMESTAIAEPKQGNQSSVEWSPRPVQPEVQDPAKVANELAFGASAASAASAPVVPVPVTVTSGEGDRTASAAAPRVGSRRTRKARLRLARLDPWSVMKTTFLFSIAFGVMLVVIAYVLWSIVLGSGALEAVNQFITTLVGDQNDEAFKVEEVINFSRIIGFTAVLAAIDVVIITAVSTLFAFLYNLAATIMGGLEVTLAED